MNKLRWVATIVAIFFMFTQTTTADFQSEEDKTVLLADSLPKSTMIVEQGSGFYITSSEIVTNHHVTLNKVYVKLTDYKGSMCSGKVEYWEQDLDLALVKTSCSGTPLKVTSTVRTGQSILLMGNPYGEDFFLSKGIVSSTRRGGYISFDAFTDFGSSGSPLVNLSGEVVGVATLKFNQINSMSLAVSTREMNHFMERAREFIAKGE